MEKMYRPQRHIYDLTRKYYLFGRDTLLKELNVQPGDRVLEAGCGTGRNLLKLVREFPDSLFFGVDASSSMIETARRKFTRHKVTNVSLATELAHTFSFADTFGLDSKFDKIVFSYSLSMMNSWRPVLENALKNLKADGEIHIVDFCDQQDLTRHFGQALKRWLAKFGVAFRPEMIEYFSDLEDSDRGRFDLRTLFGRYAFIARFQKAGSDLPALSEDRHGDAAENQTSADDGPKTVHL